MKTKPWKPNDLALMEVTTSTRKRYVEVVSYPFPAGANTGQPSQGQIIDSIMIRMVPGDPTTLREVPIALLHRPLDKNRYVHVARVHPGIGPFPEDMLRYDCAALYGPDQPEEPTDDFGRHTWRPAEPVLIYRAATGKRPQWTPARWASFCWRIEHVATFDLTKGPFTRPGDVEREIDAVHRRPAV